MNNVTSMATRLFSTSEPQIIVPLLLRNLAAATSKQSTLPKIPQIHVATVDWVKSCSWYRRLYHDGRPRGPLWRGKKLIGREALFVIVGLKRLKDDEEKLEKFIKTHVTRLLKLDMIAVLSELERQEEVALAIKIFGVIKKQDWYKPDVYLYKDLIVSLARSRKMEDTMKLWDSMREEGLFPDCQTYTEVIRGFLRDGSPADSMNIYEDMKLSPEPPEELPFRVLLKGLLPHPLLRNRVKQDFEEIFPELHIYDPPEEIFGFR